MKHLRSIVLSAFAGIALLLAPQSVLALESLDDMLQPYLSRYGLPALAVAVAKNGEIVAAGAVGTRRAGENIPVTVNDRFHIGSDTKAMTALIAAMLVEEGKLRWNATPSEIFPELAPEMNKEFATATLEQLLSHSSGVPSDNDAVIGVIKEAMFQGGNLDNMRTYVVREWSKKPLSFPPGKQYAYSNLGYVIAGAMIERAAGKTWEELIVERIFLPLGLTTAGLGCQATLGKVDAPLGHAMLDGKAQPFLAGPNGDNPWILGPAGLANMSVLDFARWAMWNAGEGKRGPALVKSETLRKLHSPVVSMSPPKTATPGSANGSDGYGFGWLVVKVKLVPHSLLTHSGSNNLNYADIWVDAKNDLAVVLMTNIAGEKAREALSTLMGQLYAQYAMPSVN